MKFLLLVLALVASAQATAWSWYGGHHGSSSDSSSDSFDSYSLSSDHSSSSSDSDGFSFDIYKYKGQKYYRPLCCPACDILMDHKSNFYQKCGQYMYKEELMSFRKKCKYAAGEPNYTEALEQLFEDLKQYCYTKLAVIVEFQCVPELKNPHYKWRVCKDDHVEPGQGELCFPDDEECDPCSAFFNEDSMFYYKCGRHVSPYLRRMWEASCRAECVMHGSPQRIISTIVGHCYCHDEDWVVDLCEEAPASDDCVVGDYTIPFGTVGALVDGCTQRCNCTVAREAECEAVECDEQAECDAKGDDGLDECICPEGWSGDGVVGSTFKDMEIAACHEPIPECKNKTIDMVFVLDTSASISNKDYDTMKKFVMKVVGSFDVDINGTTNIGLISYSGFAILDKSLDETLPLNQLLMRIHDVPHMKADTQTDDAIHKAQIQFEDYGRAPENTTYVMVIITDGRSTNRGHTLIEMQKFNKEFPFAVVLMVGVGEFVDNAEQRALASGLGDTNVLAAENYDALIQHVYLTAAEACSANGTKDEFTKHILLSQPSRINTVMTEYLGVFDFYDTGLPPACAGRSLWISVTTVDNVFYAIWYDQGHQLLLQQTAGQLCTTGGTQLGQVTATGADKIIHNDWTMADPILAGYDTTSSYF